ncbi:RNA polymerase factor sigma-54 [Paenibacillus aceris]|uniref:RNA polymerase sigma-54 factor n=1 Tax=Paenibacillus aceris TaxID=869555 RepID=A0ABS4I9P6_9BACL|nr:RNA polymerase factor sigma-54 [Paenibacillus aceris]MBP1967649.1 RNA polymerase sigma-54 factor [Paenibacillus aceris]NHW37516.1 RNA polymerase factor sigma-54 [Paenibacillus aceris]
MLNLNPKAVLQQSQGLTVSPKMLQSIHVLQLSSADLVSYVHEQSAENPLLELAWTESMRSRKPNNNGKTRADSNRSVPFIDLAANPEDTLEMNLLSQLRFAKLTKHQYMIAKFLVGNLNEKGYLTITIKETSHCLQVTQDEVVQVLSKVQALEPPGIAARTLQECLEIQIRRDQNADPYAEMLVSSHLSELGNGKWKYLDKGLGIPLDLIKKSMAYIRTLNPKPGIAFKHHQQMNLKPDAEIYKELNHYIVLLYHDGVPKVSLNKNVMQLLSESDTKEVADYKRKHMQSARMLIQSLEDRKHTLVRVIEAIIEEQQMFLERGLFYLKPLKLKAIADKLGLHESTVSRTIQNKVVQTPQGIYELKFFFATALTTTDGDSASAERMKYRIRELIEDENKNKPLSDQQITDLMNKGGMQISRRTVMKYREEMNILSSRLRG